MATNKKPTLNEISKKSPFKVPDNYFEDFASRMQETIAEENKVVPMFQRLRPYLYVAASVVVILTVSLFAFNGNEKETEMMAGKDADTTQVTEPLNKQVAMSTKEVDDVYLDELDDEELFEELYDEMYDDI